MIVTLLTDFGESDAYVAAMKGVMLSRNPAIQLVDISHQVPPQRIATASYLLLTCFAEFPAGAVHMVVVDPGVGSERRAIACRAGNWFWVAPDNGVLGPLLNRFDDTEVREISGEMLARANRSTTFHGRDIFAPAAAALADGFPFEKVGPTIEDWNRGDELFAQPGAKEAQCQVLHVDHFGNLILNVRAAELQGDVAHYRYRDDRTMVEQWRRFFADGDSASPFLYVGSSGFVEIAINGGSAAHVLGRGTGDAVCLERG